MCAAVRSHIVGIPSLIANQKMDKTNAFLTHNVCVRVLHHVLCALRACRACLSCSVCIKLHTLMLSVCPFFRHSHAKTWVQRRNEKKVPQLCECGFLAYRVRTRTLAVPCWRTTSSSSSSPRKSLSYFATTYSTTNTKVSYSLFGYKCFCAFLSCRTDQDPRSPLRPLRCREGDAPARQDDRLEISGALRRRCFRTFALTQSVRQYQQKPNNH